jgi:hypothetical protein
VSNTKPEEERFFEKSTDEENERLHRIAFGFGLKELRREEDGNWAPLPVELSSTRIP